MPPGQLDTLAAAASVVTFPAGHRIFDDGGFAATFWLIQSGQVALDVHLPGSGRVTVDSIGIGDCRPLLAVPLPVGVRRDLPHPGTGIPIDAAAIRARCTADPQFGAELRQRLLQVLARRLQHTRTRLITTTMSHGGDGCNRVAYSDRIRRRAVDLAGPRAR